MRTILFLTLGIILTSCGMFGKKKSNPGIQVDSAQIEEAAIDEATVDETLTNGEVAGDANGEAPSPETMEGEAVTENTEPAPMMEEAEVPPPPSVLRTKTEFKATVARMWGHKQSDIDSTYALVQNSLPASSVAEGNIHPEFLTAIARLSSAACDLFWMKKNDAGDWDDNTSQETWMNEILSRAFIKDADRTNAKTEIEAQLLLSTEMSNSEKFSLSCSIVTASKAFL